MWMIVGDRKKWCRRVSEEEENGRWAVDLVAEPSR